MTKHLSSAEERWYWYFKSRYEPDFKVCQRQRVADIVADWRDIKWFFIKHPPSWVLPSQIKDKYFSCHFDFVICEAITNEPVFILEINGDKHNPLNTPSN